MTCPWNGEIEVNKSYFGGVRKGKRGRGAAEEGNVRTVIVRLSSPFLTIRTLCCPQASTKAHGSALSAKKSTLTPFPNFPSFEIIYSTSLPFYGSLIK